MTNEERIKLKIDVLNLGLDKVKRQYDLKLWQALKTKDSEAFEKANEDLYFNFTCCYGGEYEYIATCLNNAYYKRKTRLNKKIENILAVGNLLGLTPVFMTLTFNDKSLNNTNEDTRRQKVRRFLKSASGMYVANVDYGEKNEREHYHAVCLIDTERYPLTRKANNNFILKNKELELMYNYGFIDIEKINIFKEENEEDHIKRISKYMSKLVNHALKNSTKNKRLLYSAI